MNLFKKKQIIRIVETIGKASSESKDDIKNEIDKYAGYSDYKIAIEDLICIVYDKFNKIEPEKCDYILDMINGMLPKYFDSKEDMIDFIRSRDK